MTAARLPVTVLMLFCGHGIIAQSAEPTQRPLKATFYYNVNWQLTTPEKAVYKRVAYFDFVNMVFDGIYKDYFNETMLMAEGSYSRGTKGGFHNEYFRDRKLKSTIEYQNKDFTVWEFRDEAKIDSVKNGTGAFSTSYFYLSGLVSQPTWNQGMLHGEFRAGKKSGTWVYQNLNKLKTDEEIYDNGKLVKRLHFSESATVELTYPKEIILSINALLTEAMVFDKSSYSQVNDYFERQMAYPVSFSRTVTFVRGMKELLLLLAQNAEIPEGNVCILKLRIDQHGKVMKYAVQASAGPEFDKAAMKAVKAVENKFLPAIKNGLPYPSWIFLPVSGGDYWISYVNETPIELLLMMR